MNTGLVESFYIDIRAVTKITSFSRSTILVLEKNGQFPKRVKINVNNVRWKHKDIISWCQLVEIKGGYPPKNYYNKS